MTDQDFRVFVQARMSSTRFPGKVLAPFRGRPMIDHVVSRVSEAVPLDRITVATSTQSSDDPIEAYVEEMGVAVFRGALENVLGRFQACLEEYPCRWLFRVSADSPLFDQAVFSLMLPHLNRTDLDIVTNVYPRTFPRGNSLEMLETSTFARLDSDSLRAELNEHVTKTYYENPSMYRILNVESSGEDRSQIDLCVDTVDDLRRLEALAEEQQVAAWRVGA